MTELWLPGSDGPLDELVARIHVRIEGFLAEQRLAVVEVELYDGTRRALRSISAQPGLGFVTISPHPGEDGVAEEWIVPVTSIRRIRLAAAEEGEPFGFTLPAPG
jgi:hypothetical protein